MLVEVAAPCLDARRRRWSLLKLCRLLPSERCPGSDGAWTRDSRLSANSVHIPGPGRDQQGFHEHALAGSCGRCEGEDLDEALDVTSVLEQQLHMQQGGSWAPDCTIPTQQASELMQRARSACSQGRLKAGRAIEASAERLWLRSDARLGAARLGL